MIRHGKEPLRFAAALAACVLAVVATGAACDSFQTDLCHGSGCTKQPCQGAWCAGAPAGITAVYRSVGPGNATNVADETNHRAPLGCGPRGCPKKAAGYFFILSGKIDRLVCAERATATGIRAWASPSSALGVTEPRISL